MPRRRRQRKDNLDFEIHEDTDTETPAMSDVKDFAQSDSRRESVDDGQHLTNYATASSMTGVSTLVNEDNGEAEEKATSSLKGLKAKVTDEEEELALEEVGEDITPAAASEESTPTQLQPTTSDPKEFPDLDEQSTHDESMNEEQDVTEAEASRRESGMTTDSRGPDRRTSARTEALIHRAARDIVEKIEHDRGRESLTSVTSAGEEEESFKSDSAHTSPRQSDAYSSRFSQHADDQAEEISYAASSRHTSARPSAAHSSQQPTRTSIRHSDAHESVQDASDMSYVSDRPVSVADDEGSAAGTERHHASADEGSEHHENEDDVFSDHSPRSSLGSLSDADQRKLAHNVTQRSQSPRISGISQYSYQEQEFVPTLRSTPRPAFRSPSSVKAMQMSSPPASVLGSPRSSRRTPLPTVSRIGSPSVSAQYSPKKTPPRFKRSTPPLVLLHVTLLPLRWPWGDTLENARNDELSEGGRGVKEAWRTLQDRMGDTTCERGILLPHPQNDFEVLEERLLEALELPLRRRARILECGHYLGPSNDMSLEESDSEDEYYEDEQPRNSLSEKKHWCSTCRSEIRYDSLGVGKVFRVKVYASNGLMKAGAWEACWKDMERVDIEIEPIVEADVQDEIGCLADEQERAMELHQEVLDAEEALAAEFGDEAEISYLEQEPSEMDIMPSSPPPEARAPSPPAPETVRNLRQSDDERMREIYGGPSVARAPTPTPEPTEPTYESPEPTREEIPTPSYHSPPTTSHQSPPSPSAEAHARREDRRQTYKSASLPELILQAGKVMLQDRKNIMIGLMSVLIVLLAVRGTGGERSRVEESFQVVRAPEEVPKVMAIEMGIESRTTTESVIPSLEALSSSVVASVEAAVAVSSSATPSSAGELSSTPEASIDPCASRVEEAQVSLAVVKGAEASSEVVREVETIRVFETVTERVVETVTATYTESVQETVTEEGRHSASNVSQESVQGLVVDDLIEDEVMEDPLMAVLLAKLIEEYAEEMFDEVDDSEDAVESEEELEDLKE